MFMDRVGVGVKKTNCDGLDLGFPQLLYDVLDVLLMKPLEDLPTVEYSLADLEAEPPRDQGVGTTDAPVVQIRPVLTADLEDVTKPFGDNEGSLGAFALQKSVGRDGSAVDEEPDGIGRYR